MPIRSRMSSIMGQIDSEHPELLALEFGKIAEYDFISTKLGHNVYVHKISDEFYNGTNQTGTAQVVCP